jgi:hypothetical protein
MNSSVKMSNDIQSCVIDIPSFFLGESAYNYAFCDVKRKFDIAFENVENVEEVEEQQNDKSMKKQKKIK